jgi:hypothetical protein
MTKLLSVSAALLLSVSVSQASLAQGRSDDKPGKDRGGGAEHAHGRDDHPGKGKGRDKGPEAKDHGRHDERPEVRARLDDRREDRAPTVVVRDDAGRGRDHDRGLDRDHDRDRDRPPQVVVVPYRDYGVLQGCPPGLAKKNNGCLPPGQAKKIERARYDLAWRAPVGDVVYRYDDGYQYRYDRQGSLLGYLPALGGALGVGNLWPTQYRYDPAPAYQRDYFGLNQPYDYRYANGALYGVDPKTSTIQQVVALLTGQTPAVGQRMPAGYDIYNVPYAYRDRYADSPSALYRYNDGAIYQLDPTTQVIQAVIQLLA